MDNNTLYHYGVIGQKWGVRRFQRPDGSLTPAGKKRYAAAFEPTVKTGKDKAPISPAEKVARETGNAINNASTINRSISNIKQSSKKESMVSNMTDEELRKAINRMDLENRYTSLSAERTNRGMSYVDETLKIAGGITGIAASTLAIITTINKLKGGG